MREIKMKINTQGILGFVLLYYCFQSMILEPRDLDFLESLMFGFSFQPAMNEITHGKYGIITSYLTIAYLGCILSFWIFKTSRKAMLILIFILTLVRWGFDAFMYKLLVIDGPFNAYLDPTISWMTILIFIVGLSLVYDAFMDTAPKKLPVTASEKSPVTKSTT